MQKIILQFLFSFLIRNFLRVIVGIQFKVADFLKLENQFIIVANHNSHLDTMTLMAAMPKEILHRVRPVAAADHFGKTKIKEKLTNFFVNSLLIKRKRDKDSPENDPIHIMLQAIDDGYSLIIFPEGTRGEAEVQQPFKPGIGIILSQRPNIKYVPAFMYGMGKAMPKDDSLILPFSSYLEFGRPTIISSIDKMEIVAEVEKKIYDLKKQNF